NRLTLASPPTVRPSLCSQPASWKAASSSPRSVGSVEPSGAVWTASSSLPKMRAFSALVTTAQLSFPAPLAPLASARWAPWTGAAGASPLSSALRARPRRTRSRAVSASTLTVVPALCVRSTSPFSVTPVQGHASVIFGMVAAPSAGCESSTHPKGERHGVPLGSRRIRVRQPDRTAELGDASNDLRQGYRRCSLHQVPPHLLELALRLHLSVVIPFKDHINVLPHAGGCSAAYASQTQIRQLVAAPGGNRDGDDGSQQVDHQLLVIVGHHSPLAASRARVRARS